MDLDGSLALYASGRAKWNNWAASMTERQRALVATGKWAWALDSRADPYPTNEETQRWCQEAAAEFSYHEFADPPDFSGFDFPAVGMFVAAKFPEGARFCAARFRGGACFNFVRFDATAEFTDANFHSYGTFSEAQFFGGAWFDRCRFVSGEYEPDERGQLDCSDAKFAMPVSFVEIGCRSAIFSNAEFAQTVNFDRATFDELFFLYETVFRGQVLVRGVKFPDEVDWSSATLAIPPIHRG